MLKKIVLFVTVTVAMLFASVSSAYTIVQSNIPGQLGQHHQELTITATPGEPVYLPVPKHDVAVRVEITATGVNGPAAYGPYMTTFTVAMFNDFNGNPGYPTMSRPTYALPPSIPSEEIVAQCGIEFNKLYGTAYAFIASGISTNECAGANLTDYTDALAVGMTHQNVDPTATPRIFFGILNPDPSHMAIQVFRVSMWW